MLRLLLRAWIVAFVFALPAAAPTAQAQRARLTLQDLFASPKFYPRPFTGGEWTADGPVVTFVDADDRGTHLVSYNLETGERKVLIDGAKLTAPDTGSLLEIESYEYSRDGAKVLLFADSEPVWRFNTKGYYYLYDVASGAVKPISDRARGFQMFAKMNPAATQVGFVRERNLFVVDLATGAERQLTRDGSEGGVINGTTDWVYEEEFGLRDAWAWSPGGKYIAFLQLDESETRDFFMADLRGHYPEAISFRYPKAGEANSEIRLGVIEAASGATRFFEAGTWKAGGDSLEYIPRFGWTPGEEGASQVWFFRMNRDQNHLELLYGRPDTGALRTVMTETDAAWIELDSQFTELKARLVTYLNDGKHFLFLSPRDGRRHLYLYTNEGRLVRQLTQGDWDVTNMNGVDEKSGSIFVTATLEGSTQRHIYRVPFSLKGNAPGKPVRLTEGAGWHDADFSRDYKYFIDTYAEPLLPPVTTLRRADGGAVKVLESNEALRERLRAYDLAAPEFMTVPGADGTPLNALMIKPHDFDPAKRYPVLMHVYGGPGSQEVTTGWMGVQGLWHYYLADEMGVIVAVVDNRGTGGRGKEFLGAVYRRLGVLEAQDQIAAAKHFGGLPYVDRERIGIWGWSYGGFMTLMSMLTADGPQTFKVGMSVAPVTDQRLYDTIYTERYMSTPQRNPEGYQASSAVAYADRLAPRQRLLIVHGDLDDNVHVQNTFQMVDALQRANKQFDMMIYPGKNHGIYGGLTRLHLFTMLTDYVRENL